MKALPAVGAELTASDGAASDGFGRAVAIAGSLAVAGASADGSSKGAGYLFSNISTLAGSGTQSAKLTASDGAASDYLGYSAGVSWAGVLLGAHGDDDKGADAGAAYFYRSYSIGSGTVTQNTKLLASDGAAGDQFGISASMSGTTGLVGASGDASGRGAAYVFRDVYSAQPSITQSVKLTAADGEASDAFGVAVSMSGNGALVGATGDDDKGANAGAAYFFRNLASVTGTVTQNLKLVANDGAAGDNFGVAVGLFDTTALVGASGDASGRGAAYVFRGLGTGSGTKTHTTKLTASDGAASDGLGVSVALSGSVGLAGATGDDDKGTNAGAAYVYLGLDATGSTATETVKLLASDGAASDAFGFSVGLDGDYFVIGARLGNGAVADSGNAYVGRISAFTTLNGSLWQTAATDGLSFVSRADWVAGGTTDAQTLVLSGGDSASVVSAGKAVFIGQEAGADSNNLIVAGALTATTVNIGRPGDNTGNLLRFDSSATIAVGSIYLADDNLLVLAGDYSNISTLISRLGSGVLKAWNEGTGQWQGVTAANYSGLVQPRYLNGYTLVPTRAFANNLVALDAAVPGVMNAGGTASLFSEYAFGLTGPVDLTLSAANIGDSTSYNLLTVQRGARLTSQNAYVGQGADGDHNAVKITGARSQWTVHDQFRLGEQGSGATLSVTDGGVLKPSNFYVGYEGGSTGNLVTVGGAGSGIEGSNLWLGYGGGGNSLSVTAGGKVSGYNFALGQLAGSDENSLTVDGVGSLFSPSSNFVVGKAGSDNTAVVSGGATLQSSVNMLGEATGAENNSVTVSGTGSLWTIANILTVGGEGSRNRVSVLAGGKVQGAVTYLGYQSGSSANTLTVGGAGSSYAASFGNIVVQGGTDPQATAEAVLQMIEQRVKDALSGIYADIEYAG